jgi:hypothetical protein
MAQMAFPEHNNMVKTIPSDRTDESLGIPVLPWRPRRNRSVPDTHCSKPLDDDIAIEAIPIANDILRRLLPAVRFGQLTGNPMGAWTCGHAQPQKLAPGMLQDQKSIQQPKRDRRDYEQIHRRNAVSVIVQKGLPALRRWLPSPHHVFCHGGLPDIDAKLEQFAMDPRCSPKRVRSAHVANELANVRRCSLAGQRPVGISSANRLGNQRGASGSSSAASEFLVRPILQELHDRAPQTPGGQYCRTPIASGICAAAR